MLFSEVVAASADVAATSARSAKTARLAELLSSLGQDEVVPTVGFLTGEPRQGRIGVGWRTLANVEAPPAGEASIEILEVDATIAELAVTSGPGSGGRRNELLAGLLGRATADEQWFLRRLFGGELRQGANEGVMADAIAKAAGVPGPVVRRAHMLGGRLDECAAVALTGGREALEAVGLVVGRGVQPMLASTAASVTEAVQALGLASVEWKLDGIRVQAHRSGDDVRVYTRNLNEITERVPDVVAAVAGLPVDSVVLDGEAISFDATGRPRMFQETVSWREGAEVPVGGGLRPFFFDVLHVDGTDLIDEPLSHRLAELARVAGPWQIPGTTTEDPALGEAVLAEALAAGHEGVVVKGVDSTYDAGRRGKAWRKVKPVHTLDLVVLAVEWGSGRRRGWLSNLHLGARDPDGGFVMVGKTFKGLTDELLRWQTERFLELKEREETWGGEQSGVVWVRPEQVVEIALDGVQSSTRYPGGVALRFARVVRYRQDKSPDEADLIGTVQAMLPS